MFIGCHLSAAKGFEAMGRDALSIGADTFQFFTRNPRGGKAKPMDAGDTAALLTLCAAHGFGPLVAHAPYTLNACAAEPRIREFAHLCLSDDLARMAAFPDSLYNFHPGSHVGQGAQQGISLTCGLLNKLLTPQINITVLFETMSGQGSEIGRDFYELAALLDGVEPDRKVGVCLDTCHVFAAGYDVRNDLDHVLTQFDTLIGLHRLKAVHLNDSKFPLGAHRDRHEKIGQGEIGLAAIQNVVRHPALQGLPFILETPNELDGYAQEIQLLRSCVQGIMHN